MIIHLVLALRNRKELARVRQYYYLVMNHLLISVIDRMADEQMVMHPRYHRHHLRMD